MPHISIRSRLYLTSAAIAGLMMASSFSTAQQASDVAQPANAPDSLAESLAENTPKTSSEIVPQNPEVAAPISADADVGTDVATDAITEPPVDYTIMNRLMERLSVNEKGRPAIAYKLLREKGLPVVSEYESMLTAVDTASLDADARLAHWLNLQNILVVKAIASDTKKTNLKSFRGSGEKPGKLWTKKRVDIDGQSYSIADVENKILSEFDDPNVLYGLYQGVKGAPCISDTAYQAESVHERLAELGMRYVNSRGIVSPNKGVVTLTPIYDWYKESLFKNDDKAIMKHVKSHANTALRGRLNTGRDIKYTKLNYTADNYVVPKGTKLATPQRRQAPQRQSQRPQRPQQPPRGGGSYGS